MTSSIDPLTYLQILINRDHAADHRGKKMFAPDEELPLVITISRDYGAEGEVIANKLAECLNIPLYDEEILNRIAERAKIDKIHVQEHDEHAAALTTTFFYSIFRGSSLQKEQYRRYLYDVVLDMGRHHGILMGRGAHFILSSKKIFRLRIIGSPERCAERIAAELNISTAEAAHQVREINQERHASITGLFDKIVPHCSLDYAPNFDLIINTDHIHADHAVPIILLALQQFGFDLGKLPKKKQ